MSLEPYPSREERLGDLVIARALPARGRRMIGPWCFLDRFGPLSFTDAKPMDVAPHPHIGLQTVSWLLDGEILHDDSLGSEALLRPGGVNVMTSGAGIAHAEQTPRAHTGRLNGVQLWTALPDADRHGAAAFVHVPEVPAFEARGGAVRIFSGELFGASARSAAPHFSPIVGAEIAVAAASGFARPSDAALGVPLDPSFEHGLLILDGDAAVDGQALAPRVLYYLGPQRTSVEFASRAGGRVLLIGGAPFGESILMWWNFVARTPEEIAAARAQWVAHQHFGDVPAYRGPRLDAPALTRLAHPNPIS